MQVLGVQTGDFAAYYDLVQLLRARHIPFVPVAPGEDLPPNVAVLIATGPAVSAPTGVRVVPFTAPERTLEEALLVLGAPGPYRRCVIGIDPGERPGIAVLADGRVVRLIHAASPEAVRGAVDGVLATLSAERLIVRIGNGAPTFRDRILQTLAGLPVALELVDEAHSTPTAAHGNAARDTQAATRIALTPGQPLAASDVGPVRPTAGELRDIQRKSRLASDGQVTISRSLARYVAMGRMSLAEAVEKQRGRA